MLIWFAFVCLNLGSLLFIVKKRGTMREKDITEKVLLSFNDVFADVVNGAVFAGNEHIYPVFTIVIYWGKSEWKAPITLKDRLDCPDELIDIVSDHKFKLIDMVRLSDEDIEKYKGDFNLIAGIIGNPDSYEPENREIKHPEVVLDLLDAVIGDERFGEIKDEIVNIKKEGRKVDMCEFLDKIENRGVEKGKLEGRNEGEELATFRIAKNFKDSKVDVEIIVKATGLTKEQIEAL